MWNENRGLTSDHLVPLGVIEGDIER